MSNLSKFEVAILTVPSDLISVIITYASEQAFMWTGQEPGDRNAYYLEQGRQLARFKEMAREREAK